MNERMKKICVKILFVGYLLGESVLIALDRNIKLAIVGVAAVYILGREFNDRIAVKMAACVIIFDVIVYWLSR